MDIETNRTLIHPVFGDQQQIAGGSIYNADIGVDYGVTEIDEVIVNGSVDRLENYDDNVTAGGIGAEQWNVEPV